MYSSITTPVPINPLGVSVAKAPSLAASTVQTSNLSYMKPIAPSNVLFPAPTLSSVVTGPAIYSSPVVQTKLPISRIHRIQTNPDYSAPLPAPVLSSSPRQIREPRISHKQYPQYKPLLEPEKKSKCCDYWWLFLLLGLLALGLALFFGLRALNNKSSQNPPNNQAQSKIDPKMTPKNVEGGAQPTPAAQLKNPQPKPTMTPKTFSQPSTQPKTQPSTQPTIVPKTSPNLQNSQPSHSNEVDPISVQPVTEINKGNDNTPKVAIAPETVNPVPVGFVPNSKTSVTPQSKNSVAALPGQTTQQPAAPNISTKPIQSLPFQQNHLRHALTSVSDSSQY